MRRLLLQIGTVVAVLPLATTMCTAQTSAEAVYRSNCAMCHGKTGAGATPRGEMLRVKPFTDLTVLQMTDTAMAIIVANGKGRMPGFANKLSSSQTTTIIQYIHQLQGK